MVLHKNVMGLGQLGISMTPGEQLKILALGSCVAVIAVARRYRIVGLVHVVLPNSKADEQKSIQLPGYYANTAIPALVKSFKMAGVLNAREIEIYLVGGSQMQDPNTGIDIGKRNILACRKALWKHQMAAIKEDVGFNLPRTVRVVVDTCKVFVKTLGCLEEEL